LRVECTIHLRKVGYSSTRSPAGAGSATYRGTTLTSITWINVEQTCSRKEGATHEKSFRKILCGEIRKGRGVYRLRTGGIKIHTLTL
jgi:hypothetical protein